MSGSTVYTVKSNASYDGTSCPHPDVSIGSGVDVAVTCLSTGGTMASLANGLQGNPGFYSREAQKDSDVVVVNLGPELGLLSYYRDYTLSRLFAAYSVRSETVSGTQRLRFISKNDSRLATLEQALLSVGYPVSGLLSDSYETNDISTLNTALFAARVFMAVWRA